MLGPETQIMPAYVSPHKAKPPTAPYMLPEGASIKAYHDLARIASQYMKALKQAR